MRGRKRLCEEVTIWTEAWKRKRLDEVGNEHRALLAAGSAGTMARVGRAWCLFWGAGARPRGHKAVNLLGLRLEWEIPRGVWNPWWGLSQDRDGVGSPLAALGRMTWVDRNKLQRPVQGLFGQFWSQMVSGCDDGGKECIWGTIWRWCWYNSVTGVRAEWEGVVIRLVPRFLVRAAV